MKTKFFLASGIIGITLAGFVITGCHKDTTTAPSTSTDIMPAEDDANASMAANDAKFASDAAIQWQSKSYIPSGYFPRGFGFLFADCANVHGNDTMINGMNDTVVYIDFGKNDCFCRDNRHRRGTIIVYWGLMHAGETWLQAYFDSLNTITETFKNYYFRDNGIAGMRTWTNEGHNMGGFQNWDFTANLTFTYPDGQVATWSSTRNNALTEVSGVWYYEITGNADGVSRDGGRYTVAITSPIYYTMLPWWAGGCPWPEAGIVTINRASTTSASPTTETINYGTLGVCNDTKIITVSGSSTTYPVAML